MPEADEITEPVTFRPMPALAGALRQRQERILNRWDRMVRQALPDADALTAREVRDSIPAILEQMARALETSDPAATALLTKLTGVHGTARFHESYNLKELIIEYRLLRRILMEEIDGCFAREVTAREWLALDTAVDIALQQAILSFLEHQGAQLKSATESEAKFLAFLAHDMRGGLNSLMLAMEWVALSLKDFPGLAGPREELIRARSSAEETIHSMERLLQAERLHQKAAVPRHDEVGLAALVAKVTAPFQVLASQKALRLELRVPAEARARTDAGLLTLILQNLVSNAVKYSDRGAVTVSAEARAGGEWALSVSDQGVGIAPETAARLFRAFARGPVRGTEGIGLGLFIVAQAARTIGVEIKLESVLGAGSVFTIVWPGPPASVSVESLP